VVVGRQSAPASTVPPLELPELEPLEEPELEPLEEPELEPPELEEPDPPELDALASFPPPLPWGEPLADEHAAATSARRESERPERIAW
jgi:hypothetical protein